MDPRLTRFPALGPQWYLFEPEWGEVLGRLPAALPQTQSEGRTWIWGSDDLAPTAAPPRLVPRRCNARWLTRQLDGDLFDAIENFLDPMHTPFVHAGLVRTEGERAPLDVHVVSDGSTLSATYRRARRSGLIRRLFGGVFDETVGRYCPPNRVELDYRRSTAAPEDQLVLRILLSFTPTRSGRLGLSVGLFSGLPGWLGATLALPLGPLLELALRQDLALIADKARHETMWFPERRYVHAETDLLGPSILQWLRTGRLMERDRTVRVLL